MKVLKWLLALAALVAVLLAIAVSSRLLAVSAPAEIQYTDLVVIILTALAVMLTMLGLGIAALAVVGWATFESKLKDNSFSYFATQLGKDGPLRRELEALLVEISLEGVDKAPPEDPKDKPDGDYVDE